LQQNDRTNEPLFSHPNERDKLVKPVLAFVGAIAWFFALSANAQVANAADIKCLWPNEMRPVLADVIPQFERATGHKVKAEWGTSEEIAERLGKGEAADVVIVASPQADDLRKRGGIVSGSQREIGKIGVGVFVCKGESKPDIGSVEAFKQSLLAAKSLAYVDPSSERSSGRYVKELVEKLGIADDVKGKTKLAASGEALNDIVANREAEIGINPISAIRAERRVELVGPLPAAIQSHTRYTAALGAKGSRARAGRELIRFLTSQRAQAAMQAKGLETR
jgi:molybdate transport system substrate-binding protein